MASTSYFANSHSFIISGGNFATVYGNQIINYFNCEHERKTALTIYDQFRQVIQGDIYRTADVGVYKYPRTWDDGSRLPWEKGQLRADKTVCSAEVIGTEGRMFTVVSYTGPEAREAFEKDFQAYSITLTASSFQVYGINTHVPTVLFYGEPQPAAKFSSGLGFWGKAYLTSLREQFDCDETELWMDVKKGTLCRGPVGPSCELPGGYIEWANLSSSVEFLQDANCLRFLANLKSKKIDQSVVAVTLEYWRDGVSEVEVHQPTVLSTLTNTTIAVQVGESWHAMGMGCLGERDVMENGETRFTLEDKGGQVLLTTYSGHRLFWISQASSVFYSCGISFDDDLSQYEIIWPYVGLDRPLSMSVTACQRRREKPIYIFVRPLSLPLPTEEYKTSSFHYWSFDPTGQSPLPANICEDLGLPVELSVRVWSTARYYCDNQSYKSMHQYQLARGFDPATSDFARHLGYPIYKVHDDSDRFEDFDAATVSLTQPSPDRSTSVATGKTVQPSSMLIEQNISKFAHRSSTRPPTTSKKVNAAAARKEDILGMCISSLVLNLSNLVNTLHMCSGQACSTSKNADLPRKDRFSHSKETPYPRSDGPLSFSAYDKLQISQLADVSQTKKLSCNDFNATPITGYYQISFSTVAPETTCADVYHIACVQRYCERKIGLSIQSFTSTRHYSASTSTSI
ncbi:hypothetical protein V5O48_010294 [Marasmius crinis-equi]|uniref:Uncharacterized protein n=1 Tax=Marasmius crinis-equi TaxID=585013 RepID=A0ABR3F8U7_9AGAR